MDAGKALMGQRRELKLTWQLLAANAGKLTGGVGNNDPLLLPRRRGPPAGGLVSWLANQDVSSGMQKSKRGNEARTFAPAGGLMVRAKFWRWVSQC